MAGLTRWAVLVDGSTATDALVDPVMSLTLPTTRLDVAGKSRARIMFGGAANNGTINYQVVLWSEGVPAQGAVAVTYVPELVAKGVATLGATTYAVAGLNAATNVLADTLTATTDRGVYAYTPANDDVAYLDVDCSGADWLEVETDLGTATAADVIVKVFDAGSSAGGGGIAGDDVVSGLTTINTSVGTVNTSVGTVNTTLGSPAQAGEAATAATTVVNALTVKATAASVLYDGGADNDNRLYDDKATSALLTGAAVITVAGNTLDVQVFDTTATETLTLCVAEFSAATPTVATLIRQQAVSLGADHGRTQDQSCVDLAAETEIYVKTPVSVDVTPGSYVTLCIVENITGPVYARYVQRVR